SSHKLDNDAIKVAQGSFIILAKSKQTEPLVNNNLLWLHDEILFCKLNTTKPSSANLNLFQAQQL
ncbi:hypothetical protein, partial [Salmonella sp. s54412]|uniref:hypothetical protein n=1 Tax=Salmonella sp. s54412 TaxID=3160128 RepID=UPI0037541968